MSDLMDAFWQTPPVARTLATATLVTSLGVYMGIFPAQWLYFAPYFLFQMPPQIWRAVTTFLITAPQLSILMDTYFVYSYVSQLETMSPRFSKREDLVWYLAFVSTVILLLANTIIPAGGFYLHGLTLALAYTATQDQRGLKVNFFFLTIPAQLVPYAMMLVSLIMAGPFGIFMQLCGLLAAHMYDFLARIWPEFGGGPNLLAAPAFVSRLVNTPTPGIRGFGGTVPRAGASAARAGGGSLPDSWKTRGRGQRLGE